MDSQAIYEPNIEMRIFFWDKKKKTILNKHNYLFNIARMIDVK